MKRYVALGSSMAAGPSIKPPAKGAPRGSGRSAGNYAHLLARQHNLDLIDVTFSGATTANVLAEPQRGAPPQIQALDGTEDLVTVTIGGNDVGYVPLLMAGGLPGPIRRLPILRRGIDDLMNRGLRDQALAGVSASLHAIGRTVRQRSPRARIFFVDYLTLLPPAGEPAPPLPEHVADLGRHVAARLEELTAEAASATGCELVRAAQASRGHHPWSAQPWTVGPSRSVLPWPGRPAPLHPNAAGMRAVADLVAAQL